MNCCIRPNSKDVTGLSAQPEQHPGTFKTGSAFVKIARIPAIVYLNHEHSLPDLWCLLHHLPRFVLLGRDRCSSGRQRSGRVNNPHQPPPRCHVRNGEKAGPVYCAGRGYRSAGELPNLSPALQHLPRIYCRRTPLQRGPCPCRTTATRNHTGRRKHSGLKD